MQLHFYPRPPRGGRRSTGRTPRLLHPFLSTSPARGTTIFASVDVQAQAISIHVPREGDDVRHHAGRPGDSISIHVPREGDDRSRERGCCNGQISIHVPREGDDCRRLPAGAVKSTFLSTSPARGTTKVHVSTVSQTSISIHVPREGDDAHAMSIRSVESISIHVPREGDDLCPIIGKGLAVLFLPTSPARGTTRRSHPLLCAR